MAKSEPVPNFALILSWNINECADASNNIVLLPAATRVTSSAKFAVPSTSMLSRFAVPSTSMSALRSMLPVIAKVDPSNVKLPESSSSPEVPAITTLLSVRSLIAAVSAYKESI